MKYLFIDDMPEYLKSHTRTLRRAGHTVEVARDIGTGWARITRNRTDNNFDLMIIDLALDRDIREFDPEHQEMKENLQAQGYGDLPISGQALGLRLWHQRKARQQRYCYLSNHPQLWLSNLDGEDPEFGGETPKNLPDLLLDKSDLWARNVEEKLQIAHGIWDRKGWLGVCRT